MPSQATVWTAEMVRALPDDSLRHETVDGEHFVTAAPRRLHQRAVMRMAVLLHPYVARLGDAEVLQSPADIELDPYTLVQPDVFVAPRAAGQPSEQWKDISELLLAVEVLSPSTARWDRSAKRLRYQRARVPEYWIVDLDARVVERWRPDGEKPELLVASLAWRPQVSAEPLIIDLVRYFAEVIGD
ncbi:MAG: Uma2 family endonuclease [Gemmatimonadaceae bacterium]